VKKELIENFSKVDDSLVVPDVLILSLFTI
jgi:hypothetical protein